MISTQKSCIPFPDLPVVDNSVYIFGSFSTFFSLTAWEAAKGTMLYFL